MNKITKLLGATFFCLTLLDSAYAQELKPCANTEMNQQLFDADPQFYQEHLKENARLEAIDKEAYAKGYKDDSRAAGIVYIIPVVFHILHQYGPENISDAMVVNAVKFLNEDFRKLNADNASTSATFAPISSDSEIEFRLAQKDPNGNCTNGIERIVTSQTVVTGTTTTAKNACKLQPWPRANYLNVWVVKSFADGTAGYAQFPGGTAATDGIVLLYDYVGVAGSRSHTLTHEAGHYFNLNHIWDCCSSIGTSCTGTDGVSDTPTTKGHNNTCTTASPCASGVEENAQNFMDYSYCYTMFTQGQSTRMRTALTTNTTRNTLYTTTNLTTNTGVSSPAVLCKADFTANFAANSYNTICQGSSLIYTDASWSGTPTSWSWSFEGGTPSTSTAASPTVVYNTAGTFSVSLSVSNTSGTVSTSKAGFVIVNPSTAKYSNFYSEGFEGSPIPNADWQVRNQLPSGNTWTQTAAAAATGTKSIFIQNLSTSDTYVDELISPSINMTTITGSTLTFKVAHAKKTTTSTDKLQVYVSTNCGLSWILRKTLTADSIMTAGVSTTWTTPSSTQWATKYVNLVNYVSQPNLYIRFVFTSNGGNNIYIDDINLGSSSVGIIDKLANTISFNIYPNPAEENTVVGFNLLEKQKVEIKIYDILGQNVSTIFSGNLDIGGHEYSVAQKSPLIPGAYFIKLTVGDQNFTKKLIVQ